MRKAFAWTCVALALGASVAHAGPIAGQGTWETTLLGRDISGNAVSITDPSAAFAYDTTHDLTWYLTINDAGLTWDEALKWAAGLSVNGFRGWALPNALDDCYFANCTNSQIGALWYTTLGNLSGGPMTNTGPFKNLEPNWYWTSTEFPFYRPQIIGFDTSNGDQGTLANYDHRPALAIRIGEVTAAVPEPATWGLLLAGLGLSVAALRRRSAA